MKKTLACLLLLSLIVGCGESEHTAMLTDFEEDYCVFSFQSGGLLKFSGEDQEQKFDFFLEMPHGLVSNNSQLDDDLTGRGGVVDLGMKAMRDITEVPLYGYQFALTPEEIRPGHTYCVRTASGEQYGLFHVIGFDSEAATLKITWRYPAPVEKPPSRGESEQTPKGPGNSTKADNDTDWIVKALAVRLGENELNHKQLVNTFGPLTPRKERFLCRWLEKGKAIEMVSVVKQETGQGNQTQRMYMVCRYDPKKNLFVQTTTVEGKSRPSIDLTWDRKTSRFEAEKSLPEPVGAKVELSFKWTDNKTLEGDYKIIQGDKVLLHSVITGKKTKTVANDQEFDQLKASILQPQPDSSSRVSPVDAASPDPTSPEDE